MPDGEVRIRLGHRIEPLEDWINYGVADYHQMADKVLPWCWGTQFYKPGDVNQPLADGIADVVFLDWVLHKCPHEVGETHFYGLLSECWRVLREGGVVVSETPYGASAEVWADPAVARVIVFETFLRLRNRDDCPFMIHSEVGHTGLYECADVLRVALTKEHIAPTVPDFTGRFVEVEESLEEEAVAMPVTKRRRPRRHGKRKGG